MSTGKMPPVTELTLLRDSFSHPLTISGVPYDKYARLPAVVERFTPIVRRAILSGF